MAIDAESIKSSYEKLPENQKILIPVVLAALLGGLYFYYMYTPMQAKEVSLRKKLTQMQSKLSQSQAVAADLPRFEAEAKAQKVKLKEALTKLPGSDEIPALLKSMEAIGYNSGVEFLSVKMKGEAPRGFYAEVPVDLKLMASFHEFAIFMDKLSKLPRIINISKIKLGSPKNKGGKVVLSIECRATTYKFLNKNK
ncbi:MAG: type 4a pilus biogenesis protein PilO [Proteobacteria bacterium]|nr:type 4a pilus biogenesis protein PilO [Pseudomonadota bacterium]